MSRRPRRDHRKTLTAVAAALTLCALSTSILGAPALPDAPRSAKDREPGTKAGGPRGVFDHWALRLQHGDDGVRIGAAPSAPIEDHAVSRDDGRMMVAIPVARLAVSDQWARVLAADPAALFRLSCEHDEALCQSGLLRAWRYLNARYEGRAHSKIELIRDLNKRVNAAIRYRDDLAVYGVEDYWASPAETARHGAGDCEDFAIAKMWMLAALGVPIATMRVEVVNDTRRGLGHAVLKLTMGETDLILDNLTDAVVEQKSVPWYRPLYAVAVNGSWIYGSVPSTRVAASAEPAGGPAMDPRLELRGGLPIR